MPQLRSQSRAKKDQSEKKAAGGRGRGGKAAGAGAKGIGEAQAAAAEPIRPNPADMEPPAADMRGKEEGETEKDLPVEEKVKEDEASTAPLPEKVRPPVGLQCQCALPWAPEARPITFARDEVRQRHPPSTNCSTIG